MRKKDSIFGLRFIPRFLCCLMFATWPPGPASSPALSSIFCCTPHSSASARTRLTPARLVLPHTAGAAAAAASCELRPQTSRKNLSRLATQGRPDQHQHQCKSRSRDSEEKGNNKYILLLNLIIILKA